MCVCEDRYAYLFLQDFTWILYCGAKDRITEAPSSYPTLGIDCCLCVCVCVCDPMKSIRLHRTPYIITFM